MGGWRRFCAATIVAALLLAGCSSEPPPDEPLAAVAQGGGFVLAMTLPTNHFVIGDAIDVRTTMTWSGPAQNVVLRASGSGPVAFIFQELTGRRRILGGAMTADCAQHPFAQGVATPIPLRKSGGWSADDPDAPFYEAFYRDPQLHLPAGRWRVMAEVDGYLADCSDNAPRVKLRATLEIGVG